MRSYLKYLALLFTFIFLVAILGTYVLDSVQKKWLEKDIIKRSQLIYASIEDTIRTSIADKNWSAGERTLNRISRIENLPGIKVCSNLAEPMLPSEKSSIQNSDLNPVFTCEFLSGLDNFAKLPMGKAEVFISRFALPEQSQPTYTLYVINDVTLSQERYEITRTVAFLVFIFLAIIILFASSFFTRLTFEKPLEAFASFIKDLSRVGTSKKHNLKKLSQTEFGPLVEDLLKFTQDTRLLRQTASGGGFWNSDRLKKYATEKFSDLPLYAISNREPYIHSFDDKGTISVKKPPSGLITGVEPVVKACNGIWIAQGSGSADKATVDSSDCIQVPEGNSEYTLRRIWLEKEEEEGFYNGFSNEGLWALCHIAHQRPRFERSDWEHYIKVNQKFAKAFEEQSKGEPAVVLIQDYHFALLPRMIREISPQSLILLFWHIPWPNAETFGICPWRQEIVEGMLGADVLGFHTRYHCNNFIDTVDRYVESRIDRERSIVEQQGQECRIRSFPISIPWTGEPLAADNPSQVDIRKQLELPPNTIIAIGVDRIDYTKGIVERLLGVERFIERRPELASKFAFIQIGAPSRTNISVYRQHMEDVLAQVDRINRKFRPAINRDLVKLRLYSHSSEEIRPFYEQSNICVVTPIHDGMNLVAKEFVTHRHNENGVLILSQFAGAARELREALIINPYVPDDIASKLIEAIEMSGEEQRDRMRRMRSTVKENNVYKWAYQQLKELSDVRHTRAFVHEKGAPSSAPRNINNIVLI